MDHISAKPRIQVTAALIARENKVLVVRRGPQDRHPGRWEFPGGKLEPGEDLPACVVREIEEELGARIEIRDRLVGVDHEYEDMALTLHGFLCRLMEGAVIRETADCRWITGPELMAFDLLPPDQILAQAWIDSERPDHRGKS